MARFPAFATSLAVHATAFAIVVLLPLFVPGPLPEATSGPPTLPPWPLHPRVAFADSPPPRAEARVKGTPRRAAAVPAQPSEPEEVVPTEVPPAPPSDEQFDPEASGEASLSAGSSGSGLGSADGDPSGGGGAETGGSRGTRLRVGGEVRPPAKLRHVKPAYPELARITRTAGTVVLDCLIDDAGRVAEVRVISGHPLLAPAAAEAVGQWLYSPTLLNGVPVPVLLTVTVRFELPR
jgi:protein TonB